MLDLPGQTATTASALITAMALKNVSSSCWVSRMLFVSLGSPTATTTTTLNDLYRNAGNYMYRLQ